MDRREERGTVSEEERGGRRGDEKADMEYGYE